jgi:hypothetical protein
MNVEFIFKDLNRMGGFTKTIMPSIKIVKPSFENIKHLKIDQNITMLYNIPSKYIRNLPVDLYNSCQYLASMVTMHKMQMPKHQSICIYDII